MNEKLEDLDRISSEVEADLPPQSRRLLAALRRIRERLSRPSTR